MKKLISLTISSGLILNLTACGTILHPERKGQTDGRLDTSVVLLDALGLLFFFVPGVVAFAVDFSNGTIYLPGGFTSQLSEEELQSVIKEGKVDEQKLKAMVSQKTALQIPESQLYSQPLADSSQVALMMKPYNKPLLAMQ
ncbi:hypothetical protein [Alteromonas lipolytica]|uniref:Uncharacterized protein n=1 Tax=Alteromonas lipolytica TaxID=1856405 RepID=A0A1E8F9E2_9ALTE|nr:hypothetical protein [Alteromonas lipolytica]OFI32541.1 hypothetical protein BFC17_05115 [Alteromonas lipolytica]GGF75240.1 hypothetical protein GCM10011338_29200 [Alteromonas lipolytica]